MDTLIAKRRTETAEAEATGGAAPGDLKGMIKDCLRELMQEQRELKPVPADRKDRDVQRDSGHSQDYDYGWRGKGRGKGKGYHFQKPGKRLREQRREFHPYQGPGFPVQQGFPYPVHQAFPVQQAFPVHQGSPPGYPVQQVPSPVQPVGITLTIPQLLALTAGDVVPTPDSPKSKSTEFLDLGDLVTDWGLEPEEIQSIWDDLQRHKQKMSHSLSHHLRTSLDPPSLGRARVSHWLDNVTVPGNPSLYLDPNSPSALVPFQDTFKLKKHLIAGEDPPLSKNSG